MSVRRRIWCEAEDLGPVCRPGVLGALASRQIELIAAVFPRTIEQLPALLSACESSGVRVSLWPMLEDRDGRWANASTAGRYAAFAAEALRRADGRPLASLFVDLEPPIALVKQALRAPHRALLSPRPRGGLASSLAPIAALADEAARRGTPLSAAALPLATLPERASAGWERALGVPTGGVPWEAVHVMMYSSLLEGYSRGLLGPALGRDLLALTARAARRRFGSRAALSLGVVGPGALGDERPLDDVGALRRDVAAARAEGVEDLALFDLVGALRRPPLEPWLDALLTDPARPARASAAARGLAGACLGGGLLLSALLAQNDSPPRGQESP